MAIILTKGPHPSQPCHVCGGVEFWRGSSGSPFWRCATCQPPEAAYASRRLPRNIERFRLSDPAHA